MTETIGIWETSIVEDIEPAVREILSGDTELFELDTVYVFGSFGRGDGVPGESDLDLLVIGSLFGVHNSTERRTAKQSIQKQLENNLELDTTVFTDIDVFVDEPINEQEALQQYSFYGSTKCAYNVTEQKTILVDSM